MSHNFGTGGDDTSASPVTPALTRKPVDRVRVARVVATVVSIGAIAAAGVSIALGVGPHDVAMAGYAERAADARQVLQSLEGEQGPSTADVERVYAAMVDDAAPITEFERTGEGYEEAAAATDGSLPARLCGADGITVEFSPSYTYDNGAYTCAWLVWGPDGDLFAYATAVYDEAEGLFSFRDYGETHAGLAAEPVTVGDGGPTSNEPDDDVESTGDEGTADDPAARDALQSGVNSEEGDADA